MIEILRLHIDVTRTQTHIDAALLALDREHACSCHRGRTWLGATHTTETSGEYPASIPTATVLLTRHLGKGLIGTLNDALTPDIDPTAGGHLPVHGETFGIQFVEVLPCSPVRHQIAIGNQHPWRIGVGAKNAYRLSALNQ